MLEYARKKGLDNMILALDIGNTNIVMGGFEEDKLNFVVRIATSPSKTEDEYASKIRSILSMHGVTEESIDGAIVSSVVPPLNPIVKKALKIVYNVDAIMIEPGIKTGINLKCDDPSSVGADLICACVAAKEIYASPSLVIDMGTATKILLLDDSGAFCGASIIPGVIMGLNSLSSGTAQLPQVNLEAPKSVAGKNTIDCMKSGVVYGNSAMIDGMIDRFFAEYGKEIPVYATGGLASTIIPHCKHEITVDDNLLLKGLNIIYNKNKI